ncbi:MAG: hypothetical protein ACYC4L_18640 [Chloroflexota bacterium]
MNEMIPDAKIARHRAFWAREETDRPLIGTTISTFPSVRAVRGQGIVQPEDIDFAEHLREHDEEWEQWREASGDAVWCAMPIWAFPWHLALAGSPIRHDEDNLWGLPALADWSQLPSIRFDAANPWFRKYRELTAALVEHARGRYPVGLGPLILNPIDAMMQLRGQERLALDFYDAPDEVMKLGERLVAQQAEATKALYEGLPTYAGGYVGSSRYLWAPDVFVEGGEDATFMTSPALYRRFFAPVHQSMGRRFPYYMVHLHSAQLHTAPDLLALDEVAAIEITPDFGEDMRPHLPIMKQILERKPLLLHGVIALDAAQEIISALPARGLGVFVRCGSPAEAQATLRALL